MMSNKELIVSIIGIILSSAVISFIQFLITRADNRKNIDAKLDEVKNEIKAVGDNLEEHKAIESRRGILRFYDDLRNGIDKSEDSFKQSIGDIHCYTRYCSEHPSFQNGVTVIASEYITTEYKKRFENQ